MQPTHAEFFAACEQLEPLIPKARDFATIHAEKLLSLSSRHERIFLMPRYGGKTRIGQASVFGQHEPLSLTGGWLDEEPQDRDDLSKLRRTTLGMLKLHREQRAQFPQYNPKITLRPETWDRIKNVFYWLGSHQIAQLAFPFESFYGALAEVGATPDALAQFPVAWLKTFCDAAGRLYPGLAFDALEATTKQAARTNQMTTAKWLGAAMACSRFVEAQDDVAYWLVFMSPGDRATITGRPFTLPVERFKTRIRQGRATGRQPPFGLTSTQFLRYGQIAGIWKTHKQYVRFATPYSIGASYLKARLTDEAVRRMLNP